MAMEKQGKPDLHPGSGSGRYRNPARGSGKPGLRENYSPTYYAAFVLDPDGNDIEAVTHAPA